ncbi:TetR/AcrR family transcriptional regulator [Streptomyces sp. NPDC001156]
MGEPHDRTPLPAILRSALTNESAAAVFRRLVAMRLLRRAAGRLDVPEPALPAELAVAQLIGVAIPRSVIKVEPLASADLEQLAARVAPVVQRASHEPLTSARRHRRHNGALRQHRCPPPCGRQAATRATPPLERPRGANHGDRQQPSHGCALGAVSVDGLQPGHRGDEVDHRAGTGGITLRRSRKHAARWPWPWPSIRRWRPLGHTSDAGSV